MSARVQVERGTILVYRLFDVAQSIDLPALEATARAQTDTARLRIARAGGDAVIIRNPPVSVVLADEDVTLGAEVCRCQLQARVWEYGVISMQFHIPLMPMPWADLVTMAAAIEASTSFDALARRRLDDLLAIIAPSLDTPQLWAGTEDYVIYFLHHVSGVDDVAALLEHADVPALLLGETSSALSARTRRAINEHCFQYLKQDLAVIDWNSALVVEPSAAREVPDVIEFALTHLVEFRYYDDLLDEKLAKLYAAIGGSARRLRPTSYEPLSREAGTLFMEMTEFVERVENSFKVIGDYYLATIFRASVNRMRLHEWEGNVTRKVRLLGRVSELLSAQAATHRSHSLEWIVIGLIAFEIIWALAGH